MAIDSLELRNVLGQFSTGVCVVTAIDDAQNAIGMTVNSFASVSLEPPLVLWCIQKDSDRFRAYNDASGFGVSILGEQQQELSNHYAQRLHYQLVPDSYHIGRSGQAMLNHSIATFGCVVTQRIDGGDHVIMIGEVIEMHRSEDSRPLIFFGGEYRQLR
jgi:flavin reductase (DIM6/NTAB) family NADH-FMN oxidoreductase RutF